MCEVLNALPSMHKDAKLSPRIPGQLIPPCPELVHTIATARKVFEALAVTYEDAINTARETGGGCSNLVPPLP